MGGVLGGFAGSCVAACGCQALSCCASGFSKGSRLPYLLILFIGVILAGVLRYYGQPLLQHLEAFDSVCTDPNKCYGIGAVYRITFGLTLFHAIMVLLLQVRSLLRWGADTGYWLVKILLVVALVAMAFLLPNAVFDGYRFVAQTTAGIFLVMQIVLIIDFAYAWNESWLSEGKDWKVGVLVVSLLGYVGSLVAAVLLFKYFADGPLCGLERSFIGVTIAMTLLFTVLSASERCEHGAILPSAICTVYCYWILYSALSSVNGPCNSFSGGSEDSPFMIIGGFVLAAFSVCYAGFNLAAKTEALSLQENPATVLLDSEVGDARPSLRDDDSNTTHTDIEDSSDAGSVAGEDELAELGRQGARFHLVMAASACYACMLLTDWGANMNGQHPPGMSTVWIKMVSQWLCSLLYMWSLVAPYVITNRNFDYS